MNMRKGFAIAAAIAVMGFITNYSRAEPTVTEYFYDERGPELRSLTHLWLSGVYKGLESANARLSSEHHAALFCQPQNAPLQDEQVAGIVNRYLHDIHSNVVLSSPVADYVLPAMEAAFPCRGGD